MGKDHATAMDKLLTQKSGKKTTRKKASKKVLLPEVTIRATLMLSPEIKEKMDAIAYWERKGKTETLKEAMTDYIKKYERKNGTIKPIP